MNEILILLTRLKQTHYFRIGAPFLVLLLFYWGLHLQPPHTAPEGGGSGLSPEKARELLDMSRVSLREAKYEEALAITQRLHAAYPANHIYIGQLATIHGRLGRHKEEAELWEQFFKHSPTPIEACPQMGEAYRKQGLLDKAIDAFERCLALDPKNADSLFFLGRIYEQSGQLERAKQMYEQGAKVAPQYWDFTVGLARAELRKGNLTRARTLTSKVLKQSPNNVDALLVMGMVCRLEGNLRDAKKYLQEGVKLSSSYADFHIVLGGIAEQENDIEQAIKHYDRVLELTPENREIEARRAKLTGGER